MSDMTLKGVVSLDTTNADQALAKVGAGAKTMADGVKKSATEAGSAVDKIGDGASASAKKVDQAERSIIASIQRRTAAMQAGNQSASKYYEALAGQRGVSVEVLKPYLAQLDAAQAKQKAATVSLGNMGMSAKATAAALRGVPAQLTDIAVSLQGGQRPLTVLLQQGSQLKDMFGGVGNAARAMGGYVTGLINPFTIFAGVVGAVGIAAFQGAKEFRAFNKELILNGGTSGVTADQLMSIAAGIDDINSSITRSRAAEVLGEIVNAGVRGEAQIKRYARAAAEFEVAGGGAATTVAEAFKALGKDPLQATLRLNESLGYLTESTYKQIKALEDQGRTLEAARVAQDAYASVLENRTPALLENLGAIERGWNAVKNAAKESWDAMLNIGRADTLDDQIAQVERRLEAQRKAVTLGTGNGFDLNDPRKAADEALLASLREQQKLARQASDLSAERATREKERIAFLAQGDKYLSSEQRQQKEILAIQNLVTRQVISQVEAEKRIAAIREQSAKKSGGSRSGASSREVRDEFADLYSRITLKDAGIDPSFYKDLDTLYAGYQKGRISIDEYRTAVEQLTNAQRFAQEINKANAQALETEARFISIVAEKERAWAEETERRNQSAEQMIAQIEFETSLLGLNTQERENALAMRELERLGIEQGTAAYEKYAVALQKAMLDRQQKEAAIGFWRDVNSTAESVFVDIAMNGEDAFKRIGESIKREVIQLLYEMTLKKWIFQISGVNVGGGSSTGNLLSSAAQTYMNGGSALGSSANALGSWATGNMSTGNLYGSLYANYTGTGIDGLLATNGAYGTAASTGTASSTMASGGFTGYGYLGYAALIAAAVIVAEGLYDKGYNRNALGLGKGETNRVGYTDYNSAAGMGNSTIYRGSIENANRQLGDAIGLSEKWTDILSGTVRMATLFGRKLKGFGLQADINGADVDVSGYQFYKGGLFRSNKTVRQDVDSRDADALKAEIEGIRESSKAMARAFGYGTEAIDNYTGSLKVNFKGVKDNAEAAERMQTAMDDLQFAMIKAASGGKYTKQEFERMMDGVRQSIEQFGLSTQNIADVLVQGMTGRLSEADVGAQLSEIIVGGIYNSIASNYAATIAQAFTTQIITPIFTALAAGVPISQAISKTAIANIVETAKTASQALNEIFNNAEFQAAIGSIQEAINGTAGAVTSVRAPTFRTPTIRQANTAADEAKREREQLEREILRLEGNTAELRRRELLDLKPGNRALQERIWALEDEQRITEQRNDLERQRLEILGDTAALRSLERDALDESNRALYDQIQALKDAAELKDVWRDLTNSIEDEIKRIRGEVLGDSLNGLAFVQAQFATLTAQTRALDQSAATRLPDVAGQLRDLYQTNSPSRSEFEFQVNSMLASLSETNRIVGDAVGLNSEKKNQVQDTVLADKVDALKQSFEGLIAVAKNTQQSNSDTAKLLTRVTANGNAMRTTPA